MAEVSPLLEDHINENFFRTPSPSWQVSIAKDKGLCPVITALNSLLTRDETYASEDKEDVIKLFYKLDTILTFFRYIQMLCYVICLSTLV